MKSPVKNKISSVFIPVRDIEKAKEWYSKILGLNGGEIHFGHLYTAEMQDTGMILDTMPNWRDENGELATFNVPAMMFDTDNIHDSYKFMKKNNVELVTEVQHEHFFVFKDPDGNMLMICQNNN
ncbi:VOC family protein [Virgibacillus kekensis]|uniref:VOC family protein n=1 Tax=Virgibacillus kekensis TaxID=202261 RepID=A0ABV9DQ91_9BACI